MKVVHLGDSETGGGAAHAMSRLHEALHRLGIDSRLLVRSSRAPGNAVETVATRGDADPLFPAVRNAVVRQYVELNRTSISNTHFSLHIDGADLSGVPLVTSSDIVHLHWTASFQTPADVRALLVAKPVVWTLHDLEPLTGGCHFTVGCEGYVDDCAGCPQLVRDPFSVTATTLRDKKTLWAGSRPTFVAPSRYIAERARRSAVARRAAASIVHIPHGIDVTAFPPRSKAEARHALRVPVDGLYVLCGSNHNAEKRKGLGVLDRVMAAAQAALPLENSKLRLLTVGEPKLEVHGLDGADVIQLGRVPLDVMPLVYAAADVFLHPSVEDNFPCMLLESLSCGTPAIAFDVGGVGDIVQDEVCGRLIAAGDELAMAAALSSLLDNRQHLQRMSERARSHIEEHFSDMVIARRHAELYDEVLAAWSAPGEPAGPPQNSGIDEIFPRWSTACLVEELALARERASGLAEGSRAKSERIAALERDAAARAAHLEDQSRQVQEKEAELAAIFQVAEERKALAETLHASAAGIEGLAATLQREVRDRDGDLARLTAMMDGQRAEIELLRQVAADRALLIEELHREGAEHIAALEREAAARTAIHDVAEERRALTEQLHASAASIEALAANLQNEVRNRDDLLAQLETTIGEQRAEIALAHRVAAERGLLIDDLHRAAAERTAAAQREAAALAASAADQWRQVHEKEAELGAIHAVAEERKALAERLHAAVASVEELAANLRAHLRERDAALSALEATIGEQQREIELVHRVAAERRELIDDLQRVAEERADVIDRLSAVADAAR